MVGGVNGLGLPFGLAAEAGHFAADAHAARCGRCGQGLAVASQINDDERGGWWHNGAFAQGVGVWVLAKPRRHGDGRAQALPQRGAG